jgi:hypothetical protein
MPAWKVLLVVVFGIACFALALSTIVVPITLSEEQGRWPWFAGLFAGTAAVGTLFTVFLRHADRTFKR